MGPVKITATGAKEYYYEKDIIYNADGQQDNTRWYGGGLEALGLSAGEKIKGDDFVNIVEGKNLDGNQKVQLSYEAKGRTEHSAGVDFVFSDPKSVSILEHIVGDAGIKEARIIAIETVIKHIDEHYIAYRETHDHKTEIVNAPGGGIFATFAHSTSRENDPQSHTHVIISNMVERPDGEFRGLWNKEIFKHQKEITAVYNATMSKSLAELGYAIENRGNGLYEISGMEKDLINQFSKRHENIEKTEEQLRDVLTFANDAQINRAATLESRPNKHYLSVEALKSDWNKQIQDLGYSQEIISSNVRDAAQELKANNLTPQDYINNIVQDLITNESTFSQSELLRNVLTLSMGKYDKSDFIPEMEKAKINDTIREIAPGIFSTPEMMEIEQKILDDLKQGQGKMNSLMTIPESNNFLDNYQTKNNINLTDGQKELFQAVMTSKDQFIICQGDAGSGKTTVFQAIAEAAESAGIILEGYSKTGKAVQEFIEKTGAKGQTVDSFLQNQDGIVNAIRVIDEASMLGSKQTLEMIESAKLDNCRMVLLGDVKQLPAIDAGRAFQDAQELGQLHVVRLEESIRQKTEYTRQLVEAIKDKDIDRAQQILESNNRITEIADRDERLNAVKEAYLEKGGVDNGTHIITPTNADRKALNEMIRTEIKEQGKLTSEKTITIREIVSMKEIEKRYAYNYEENQILYAQKSFNGMNPGMEARIIGIDQTNNFLNCQTIDGKDLFIDVAQNGDKIRIFNEAPREFAAGDHIVFLKNDKYLQVQNGLTGTIKNIDENGNLSLDINGKDISFNIKNYNYIDHAYAITTHKSQGASYNNDIYCAKADNVDQKQFYVAASRSRHDFEIFVDDKERFFENVKTEQQKSSTLDYIQDNKREQKLESEIQIDDKESHNEIKPDKQQEQSMEQEKPRFREMEMEL